MWMERCQVVEKEVSRPVAVEARILLPVPTIEQRQSYQVTTV